MNAVTRIAGMSLQDFMQRYDAEGPFELVDGEKRMMAPQAVGSSRIAGRLFRALADYVQEHGLGEVFIEAPFVLTPPENTGWVQGARVPDVMFVRAQRLAALKAATPHWEDLPLTIVPDLAVEIVSPSDRFSDVNRKAEAYLRDGVQMVWVIDPARRAATVYLAGSQQQTTLHGDGPLAGAEILPGFALALPRLFD